MVVVALWIWLCISLLNGTCFICADAVMDRVWLDWWFIWLCLFVMIGMVVLILVVDVNVMDSIEIWVYVLVSLIHHLHCTCACACYSLDSVCIVEWVRLIWGYVIEDIVRLSTYFLIFYFTTIHIYITIYFLYHFVIILLAIVFVSVLRVGAC